MAQGDEPHVVFGTGPVGMAIMEELVARRTRVVMVNRSGRAEAPEGVVVLHADATDPSETSQVCEGASVVYNCTNPPYTQWPALFPPLQAGILEGAASAGATLVSCENVYMYGKVEGPLTEDLPYAATTRKGRTRARMAEALLDAHRSGKVRATIGRASDFYGPRVRLSAAGERVFGAAVAGKAAQVLGNVGGPYPIRSSATSPGRSSLWGSGRRRWVRSGTFRAPRQ